MPQAIFAYHLGMDAEQYAFFRIPKLLITEPYFRRLSTDAKLLYGLMLDRMSLSMRNGWMDDDGHVYICIRAAQQAIISSGVGIAPAHGIPETIPVSLGCAMRMARLISLRTSSTLIPSRAAMTSMARRAAASCLAFVFIRFPS